MVAFKGLAVFLVVVAAVSAQHGYGGGYGGAESYTAQQGFGGSYSGSQSDGNNAAAYGAGTYDNAGVSGGDHGHHVDYYHNPQYKFEYGVKDSHTHDIKHHNEHRDGDKTEGEYSFHEADGTIRTVKYHVDGKSGFIATVHRSGHAVHPQTVQHHYGADQAAAAAGHGSY